jgi:hypothetical protein
MQGCKDIDLETSIQKQVVGEYIQEESIVNSEETRH